MSQKRLANGSSQKQETKVHGNRSTCPQGTQAMCRDWIEYLKGDELVMKVQKFFGIKYNLDQNEPNPAPRGSSDDYGEKRDDQTAEETRITITNLFWYYVFRIGTEFGDEIFYASFIPTWFWNVDGAVGRRFVLVWAVIMYIGQALKDIIRWPRPNVVKLQTKWGLEYGMPSTHAMVAVSIPFSLLIYTHERYQYSFAVGLVIATIWCCVICVSRLYLGMHSVLDIIAGLLLAIFLMIPLIPFVDHVDYWILSTTYSPIVVLLISILLVKVYPQSDKWTPTRGDTTMVVAVTAGIQIGAWVNYQSNYIITPLSPPPYPIIWPSHTMLGMLLLRTVLGLCCIVATRAIGKFITYAVACTLLGRDRTELIRSENSLQNRHKIIVDLSSKYFQSAMIGFNLQYLLPNVFRLLKIGRPDFYTEI